ncbi:MAG: hypothetical protein K6E44_01980 [Bacteroidales bacterium]|nr:hypothetical protein [Bacteroidales bacterium]
MNYLLQMSITSGQDTDSRQFTLAASSHRLAGETYDANGNRTSGTADGFTSVSYNILNLPETVTAGGHANSLGLFGGRSMRNYNGYNPSLDSKDDQLSIQCGYNYARNHKYRNKRKK